MLIIHNYHSAFSWFNHHCPLHTTANTLICFSWIMCSTLEMNPKFKILNACCMFCKWTQPLCISSLQTAFLSPEQCFQHCIAFFPEMYTTSILQTQGKEEKQTINHQKRNRCYTFPSPSSCEIMMMFTWEKAVKICWFCSKMRKLSTFPFSFSCAVESSNLLWQGLLCPKYSRISYLPFVIVVNIQIIQRKDTTRIAFSFMSWFESHILSGIVIGVTKAPN